MMHDKSEFHLSHKLLIAAIVLYIIPISGLTIDIYVPSLPAVSQYFNVEKSLVQLSITAYMIGIGIMQLFAGGITDSFGRKNPILIAMLIFIIASLCIPFAKNIYHLLFMRLIQGVMVGVIVVPLRSVFPDLFSGRALHKMMTYMTMAWSIGPIVAPAIGGYLQHYFGWKSNFYFLAIYGTLGLGLVYFCLPETSIHRHHFHVTKILRRYKEILSCWAFLRGVLINGLLYSIPILFAIVGPFWIQTVLHYSAIEFGHIALLVGVAWFLGAMTNRFLINIDIDTKAKGCLWLMLIVLASMILLHQFKPDNVTYFVMPLLLMIWLCAILFPNHFMRSVTMFPKTTGSSNALFGGFVFIISSLSSLFGTLLKSISPLPLIFAYIIIVVLCLIITYCPGALPTEEESAGTIQA